MKFQLIRSAAIVLKTKNQKILVDPWLCDKESLPPFLDPLTQSRGQTKRQPICDLPIPVEKVLDGVSFSIVSHLHPDHFDYTMDEKFAPVDYFGKLSKDLPIFLQNEDEQKILSNWGFKDIHLYKDEPQTFNGIEITRVPALHGTKVPCGPSSGFIIKAEGKTIYVAGDTIFFDEVEKTIKKYEPDYIIVNAASAENGYFGRLIMNIEDVVKTAKVSPKAKVICVHMDNVSHANVNRVQLKEGIAKEGLTNIMVPDDGEEFDL